MVGRANGSSVAVLTAVRTWHERGCVCGAPLDEHLVAVGTRSRRGARRAAGRRWAAHGVERRRVRRPFIRTTGHSSRGVSAPPRGGRGPGSGAAKGGPHAPAASRHWLVPHHGTSHGPRRRASRLQATPCGSTTYRLRPSRIRSATSSGSWRTTTSPWGRQVPPLSAPSPSRSSRASW
jgi:hypothetical protein